MALIDDVRKICDRLAPHGWHELLLKHGLDITATDLAQELDKDLSRAGNGGGIDRTIPGFEDFAQEGVRGIDPGRPARSLLYHALASPNVVATSDGQPLTEFPTLAEIDTVENYVYGSRGISIAQIRRLARRTQVAIVVYANEYRPAPDTVHQKHADLCFSRTGVARVGTAPALYEPRQRGFTPFVEGNENSLRVLPARYCAYIAALATGQESVFGPMRFQEESDNDDGDRRFWVPLHKIFEGPECIRGEDLHLTLQAHHINEKLRRIHLGLQGTGWGEPDISQSPFVFNDGIAEWSEAAESGPGMLMPVVHEKLVEPAEYQGKPLTFFVPRNSSTLSSSLEIGARRGARTAPEYVHARHMVTEDGREIDLNDHPEVASRVARGGYRARHYLDFTGDGWVDALCPELAVALPRRRPAYSLVAAPDFFPHCDQRELMDWWEQSVPTNQRNSIWRIAPETLADTRMAPNLQLSNGKLRGEFPQEDETATAIVSLPYGQPAQQMELNVPETKRHSYLPDAAAGVFAPGWDTSFDRTPDGVDHLAAYGLGSPFPEDAKLCAALSTFWPAVAPDAARTFEPNASWPTVSPLTDEEIGQTGDTSWDGMSGPRFLEAENQVECTAMDYSDYVESALENRFSLAHTGKINVSEYQSRVLAMTRAYSAVGVVNPDRRGRWSVLSFRKLGSFDPEVQTAQAQTGRALQGTVYRFELYRHGRVHNHPTDMRKRRVDVLERVQLLMDPLQILRLGTNGRWDVVRGVLNA